MVGRRVVVTSKTYLALQLDLLVVIVGDVPLCQACLTPEGACLALHQIVVGEACGNLTHWRFCMRMKDNILGADLACALFKVVAIGRGRDRLDVGSGSEHSGVESVDTPASLPALSDPELHALRPAGGCGGDNFIHAKGFPTNHQRAKAPGHVAGPGRQGPPSQWIFQIVSSYTVAVPSVPFLSLVATDRSN